MSPPRCRVGYPAPGQQSAKSVARRPHDLKFSNVVKFGWGCDSHESHEREDTFRYCFKNMYQIDCTDHRSDCVLIFGCGTPIVGIISLITMSCWVRFKQLFHKKNRIDQRLVSSSSLRSHEKCYARDDSEARVREWLQNNERSDCKYLNFCIAESKFFACAPNLVCFELESACTELECFPDRESECNSYCSD